MSAQRIETRVIDTAIKQNVVGFRCAGFDSCSVRVYPIDGAWPVDGGTAAMQLEFVVSVDGHTWGTVSGKGSNFSASGFQEVDVTDNAWIGLRVAAPGGAYPSSPAQVQVEFTPRGGAAEDEIFRGPSLSERLADRLGVEGGEGFAPIRTVH